MLFRLAVTVSLLAVPFGALAQQECDCRGTAPIQWRVQKSLPDELAFWDAFNDVLSRSLERDFGTIVRTEDDVDAIVSQLRQAARDSVDAPLFVYGDLSCFEAIEEANLTSRLGLEPVNARLLSVPMYIFAREDVLEDWEEKKKTGLRVAFFTEFEVNEAQVANIIRRMLNSIGRSNEAARYDLMGPWNNPGTMAQYLDAKEFDLVAIFDDEPSVHVASFLRGYTNIKGDGRMPLLAPIDLSAGRLASYNLMQIEGWSIFLVDYQEHDFYGFRIAQTADAPIRQGTVAVPVRHVQAEMTHVSFPVIITNLRSHASDCCMAKFWRTMSDAYVTILPLIEEYAITLEPGHSDEIAPAERVYRAYLLNAMFADRENKLRALLLYGHLTIASEQPVYDKNRQRRLSAEAAILLDVLGLSSNFSADDLLLELGLTITGEIRAKYSRNAAIPYEKALQKLREAGSRRDRARLLGDARTLLLSSLYGGTKPRTIQRGSGLWSVPEYDPYWQLTRIELIERLDIDPGEYRPAFSGLVP